MTQRRNTYLYGWLFCLSALLVATECRADGLPSFANRRLKETAENMPVRQWPKTDTICAMPEVVKGKSIVIRYNAKQEIAHLGVSLFSDMTKEMLDKTICNFLERFLLELSVVKSPADIQRRLTVENVSLKLNNEAFGSTRFNSIATVLKNMEMPADFSYRNEGLFITATWKYGTKQTLTLRFPASRELIEGKDKKESDDEWSDRLGATPEQTAGSPAPEPITEDRLEPMHGGAVWMRRGEVYGVQPLTSASYYQKVQQRFVPLYHKDYPAYSLKNLFQIPQSSEKVELQVTHRKYGHFTPRFVIRLSDFLTLFNDDFVTYSAATQNKEGKWVATVVFYHRYLNYVHMLRITTTADALFAQPIVLNADFYSNIPQHYMKNMF